MKKKIYQSLAAAFLIIAGAVNANAAPGITLTTAATTAANIYQGTSTNIIYAVKMDVVTASVTINNVQFTLSGTHDANDLSYVSVYFNATSPVISGSSYLGQTVATFAGPHTYSFAISRTLAAATSGYFIVTANVNSGATDNKTVMINGNANPVVFGYTTTVTLTNNQSNAGGTQTIQAADVAISTSSLVSGTIYQGTSTNIVYAAKMDVTTASLTVNNIQFTLSGNHDGDDLSYVSVYFNATSPVISGSSYLGQTAANFAAPHTYSIGINRTLAAATSGYFIITINVNSGATDNNTVKITGATTPVTFGYITTPNTTNTQTNGGGSQTIQAADVAISTSKLVSGTIYQGTSTNIVYAAKMEVTTASLTVNNIQFTLSGNHDGDDLSYVSVYFNATSPVISGSSYLGQTAANFAAPHAYSIGINRTLAAATSGYFIITVNVNSSATDNKTVKITGSTTPVTFGYSTTPNSTNTQSNKGGTQTIQAADVAISTTDLVSGTIYQGTSTNIVYVAKMDVTTASLTVNNIQFTLSGNHDGDDLSYVSVYFNATSPVISGSSYLGQTAANFAAPHAYSIGINRTLAAATSGYFIITVNVNSSATDNKTVKITGLTTPVTFGYSTTPNSTNTQTNAGGTQTIQAADVMLTSSTVTAGNIVAGTSTNIVYAAKMDVTTASLTVNNIQFTLTGSQDGDDLSYVGVYFNATSPVISGSSYLGQTAANFAAPHAYSIGINRTLAAATSGYFIITVNVNSGASIGKTVQINGANNPLVFGYTTTPNITNSQTNAAGVKTISATLAAPFSSTENAEAANTVKGVNTAVKIFPNPATDRVTVQFVSSIKQQVTLQLTNSSGVLQHTKIFTVEKGTNQLSMDVRSFASGVYYIKMGAANLPATLTKVMVQH